MDLKHELQFPMLSWPMHNDKNCERKKISKKQKRLPLMANVYNRMEKDNTKQPGRKSLQSNASAKRRVSS